MQAGGQVSLDQYAALQTEIKETSSHLKQFKKMWMWSMHNLEILSAMTSIMHYREKL